MSGRRALQTRAREAVNGNDEVGDVPLSGQVKSWSCSIAAWAIKAFDASRSGAAGCENTRPVWLDGSEVEQEKKPCLVEEFSTLVRRVSTDRRQSAPVGIGEAIL